MRRPIRIEIDLTTARKEAERISNELEELRAKYNLSRFEYTHSVRIAPLEIPHSHPVLTLNAQTRSETTLLRLYLHEQMHWFTSWFAFANPQRWDEILGRLEGSYPDVPVGFPDGCHDRESTYLHLIVNFLEIDAAARFVSLEDVRSDVAATVYYRWVYRTVLEDWDALAAMYTEADLLPIRTPDQMTPEDFALAASAR